MLTTLITLALSAQINQPGLTLSDLSTPRTVNEADIGIVHLSPIPQKNNDVAVVLSAQSALVMDVNSNKILFAKNIDERLPIASLTKIMTAVVTLESVSDLDEVVRVPDQAATAEGSKIWLRKGERISYRDLMYGLLISSGNDAAEALAILVGGTQEGFVEKMNLKATELGMTNTHYANPHGLDDPENYSSSKDLATLARYALKKKFIRSVVDIAQMETTSIDGIGRTLVNTNKLLGIDPEIKGLKTGSTLSAGECLLALAVNEHGNEILTVLLRSSERFGETQFLKEKIWASYVW